MAKTMILFSEVINLAGPEHEAFIKDLDAYMKKNNCVCNIKEAKSGYVVSYVHEPTGRTVANYVFRKKGPMLRIYADNISAYEAILTDWPKSMKDDIRKAGPCKRMINPDDCNQNCVMGFDFYMDGEHQQKCRNNGFFFYLEDETKPYLRQMMEKEIAARNI